VSARLAVRRTDAGWWSRLIRVIAGPPVHCVVVIGDTAWHATRGAGVERTAVPTGPAWEERAVPGVDALALRRWCEARIGAPYDTLGALLYWTPLTTRDRWTCSEFAAEGLVACGAPLALLQHSQTPRRLWRALTGAR
jgi:hypothetical protein